MSVFFKSMYMSMWSRNGEKEEIAICDLCVCGWMFVCLCLSLFLSSKFLDLGDVCVYRKRGMCFINCEVLIQIALGVKPSQFQHYN